MFRNPGKEEYVVVTFEQDYRSSNLSNQMKKRQYWIKEDGRWKIVHEGAGLSSIAVLHSRFTSGDSP